MARASVVTVGNFDGVHAGHRAILRRARELAAPAPGSNDGRRVVVLCFDPHPASVLRPGSEPPRLMSREQKLAALHAAGADEVVVLEPAPALLGLTAEEFVGQLVETYAPRAVVEGADFRFGKGRRGDVELLTEQGRRHGFATVVVAPVDVVLDDLTVVAASSSLARWLTGQGRVVDVARCLGSELAIEGRVVVGERRGRALGCPTANIEPAALEGRALPADGVYAGSVELESGKPWTAAISMGSKPTFADCPRTLEAHLLDFESDLYERQICVRFGRWLRDQEWFPSVELLKRQIERDLAAVRRTIGATIRSGA